MNDIDALERAVRDRLAAAEADRRRGQQEMAHAMANHERRAMRFNEAADRLMNDVIRPRITRLATLFPNARVEQTGPGMKRRCACLFDHVPDYPASARLEIGLCPDGAEDALIVGYSLEILPVFFRFDGHDQLSIPLGDADETIAAGWIDAKLLAFVDTYLQLQSVEQYQRENLVEDPVCRMQINRSRAEGPIQFEGESYYFCTGKCREQFAEDPIRYARTGLT